MTAPCAGKQASGSGRQIGLLHSRLNYQGITKDCGSLNSIGGVQRGVGDRDEAAPRSRCNSLLVLRLAHHEAAAAAGDPGSRGQRPVMDVMWGAQSPMPGLALAMTPYSGIRR